jgi:hypothetical protein
MHQIAKTLSSIVVFLVMTGGVSTGGVMAQSGDGLPDGALSGADQQVAGIDGLFLMPGLQELEGEVVIFDKPGGRIIEAQAQGMVTARAVDAWYAESLKANGWKSSKLSGQYFKDGEMLQLAIQENGSGRSDGITLRFSLAPKD